MMSEPSRDGLNDDILECGICEMPTLVHFYRVHCMTCFKVLCVDCRVSHPMLCRILSEPKATAP